MSEGKPGSISISDRKGDGCERRLEKESPHSKVCDSIKFSEVEMHDLMNLFMASSGQSLPDYLTERGFNGTFMEQLEKLGTTFIRKEVR